MAQRSYWTDGPGDGAGGGEGLGAPPAAAAPAAAAVPATAEAVAAAPAGRLRLAPRRASAAESSGPRPWAVNLGRLAVLLLLGGGWEALARLRIINPLFWSMPSQIGLTLYHVLATGSLVGDAEFTFESTLLGFLLGTTAGAVLGLSFWWSRYWARVAEPYLIVFEGIPKLALAPMIIIVLGLGIASKVGMAVALTIVVTTLTTYSGLKRIDPDLLRMVAALGASRWQVFAKVVLPGTLPAIISALRINIGLALTGAIVGEYVGSSRGLGRAIVYAGQVYDISLIWADILVLSALSVTLYLIVGWIEGSLLKGVLHQGQPGA